MSSTQALTGSCLCGQVRYRGTGGAEMIHCHCTDCRKRHGAPFMTSVGVPRDQFSVIQGRELLDLYPTTTGSRRWFCRSCGSKLLSDADDWDEVWVAAGTLDGPIEPGSQVHIYVRSKAAWHDILDDHPQYATQPAEWLKTKS